MAEGSRTYTAFGLKIAANKDLPGLIPIYPSEDIELRISVDEIPAWLTELADASKTLRYTSQILDEHGQPGLAAWMLGGGTYYQFHYTEGIDFFLDREGTCLWARRESNVPESYIYSYLYGPIMGFVLRVRGHVCLHAGVIAAGGKAIAFNGDPLAGKSTTVMAMAQMGYSIVSDDLAPLYIDGDTLFVKPGYPRARLRRESVRSLSAMVPHHEFPEPVGNNRLHLDLLAHGFDFCSDPLPLVAIYLLGERSDELGLPAVCAISARDALIELIATSYANRFLDHDMRMREFALLGDVVSRIPVKRLRLHSDGSRLAELCKVVTTDLEALLS